MLFTAANIVLFGLGLNGERVKLFAADTWQDALSGPQPVVRLSGSMIGIAGRREHPGFPFVAIRSKQPFGEIKTGIVPVSDQRISPHTRATLKL